MNKVIDLMKSAFSNMKSSFTDIIVVIKTKSIENVKTKDKQAKRNFIFGLVGIFVTIFILIMICVGIVTAVETGKKHKEYEEVVANIMTDYVEILERLNSSVDFGEVKVKRAFVGVYPKDTDPSYVASYYKRIGYTCAILSFPNATNKQKDLKICTVPTREGKLFLPERDRTVKVHFDMSLDSAEQNYYSVLSVENQKPTVDVNPNRVAKLINNNLKKSKKKTSDTKEDNSNVVKDNDDNDIIEEQTNDTTQKTRRIVTYTPNGYLVKIISTDSLLEKINTKDKEIVYIMNKQNGDNIDAIREIITKVGDTYNIPISYYSVDDMSSEELQKVYNMLFDEPINQSHEIPSLLLELNGTLSNYRMLLPDSNFTYEEYIDLLKNIDFISG